MPTNTKALQVAEPAGIVAGKNAVINGGFDIWQRGTSISISASSDAYTSDRWRQFTQANQATTVSRQATNDTTNLPFIQYCARIQRNSGQTGTSQMSFIQGLETVNSIPFAGKTVTMSFYARAGANFSPTSNAFNAMIYTGTGTDQFPTSYTGGASVGLTTFNITTTWVRYSITGTIPTTATEFGAYFYINPTGTAGANDYFEITGVQLELGNTATPFSRAGGNIQGELAACQRYYQRLNTIGNTYPMFAYGIGKSSTQVLMELPLRINMRVAPTSMGYGGTVVINDGTNNISLTSVTIDTALSNESYLGFAANAASGLTQYRPYILRGDNSASAYLEINAEL